MKTNENNILIKEEESLSNSYSEKNINNTGENNSLEVINESDEEEYLKKNLPNNKNDNSNNILNINNNNPNLYAKDYLKFKKKIIKQISEIENKLEKIINNNISNPNPTNNDNNNNNNELTLELTQKVNKIFENLPKISMTIEKISSLEKLNNEYFDKVSLMEIKLNNAIRDLQNSQYKYDKIYIDNLIVKGYVGPSAPYKTMSDYILNNIKNYKNLSDSFKLVTNEFKDYKKRNDNMSKEVNILLQTSRKSCNDYTDNKINIFDNEINLKLNNINENMINIRM